MNRIKPAQEFEVNDGAEDKFTSAVLEPGPREDRIFIYLLAMMMAATVLASAYVFISPRPITVLLGVFLGLCIEIGAWALHRRGAVQAASVLLPVGLWLLFSAALFTADIRSGAPWVALLLLIPVVGLLFGYRAAFLMAGANAILGLVFLLLSGQLLVSRQVIPFTPAGVWFAFTLSFFAAAVLTLLTNRRMDSAQRTAELAVQSEEEHRRRLDAVQSNLEDEISERTTDLETQLRYLQAVVAISREAGAQVDSTQLAVIVVNRLRDEFDLYYCGLFWTDAAGEWAVLQAGTGEAGQSMLARGHRIRVGSGMVGWSITNSQPRIALDVGRDAVRLSTVELPETRTEAAIPLRTRGKALGALTVQSQYPQAFNEIEIAAFQSLADQVAIAFDNARRLEESSRALETADRVRDQVGRRAWRDFLQSSPDRSVRFSSGRLVASPAPDGSRLMNARRQVFETGRPVQAFTSNGSSTPHSVLLLPIPVRGAVVGVITLSKESAPGLHAPLTSASAWQDDEISLLETIVEQLGIALDSARLYEDTQRLAYREQLASEVTDRIRQTLDIKMVLQTAAEEIQRSLNLGDIAISLIPPENPAIEPQDEAFVIESEQM